MDREKELLKQDLGNQEKPEEIKKFIEDAEMLGHEDIAELGRKKLQEISEKASSIEQTSESQISQINEFGGSNEELKNRTGEVDKKIEEVTENTQSEIKNIENQGEKIKSLKEEALERYKQGIEMFNALSSQGEESVERKMNELWNHPSDPSGKKIEGLNTASENLEYFSGDIGYINDKSKLEEIYPYYESQTSNRYIGKLLASIDGLAFAQGFNSAYVNKKNGVEIPVDINDRLKSYIDLAEKIKEIDDRKRKEYNDKINNTQK